MIRPLYRSVFLGLGRGAITGFLFGLVLFGRRTGAGHSWAGAPAAWTWVAVGAALGAIVLVINDRYDARSSRRSQDG